MCAENMGMLSICVAPHTGAWIEMPEDFNAFVKALVAPHTGAWIEIML